VRSQITTLLNQHGDSLRTVKQVMVEYVDNMGQEGSKEAIQQYKHRITTLVNEF